jgi:hypothetical protein
VKLSNLKTPNLKGIDQRIPAPKATAALMENWRSDWETGGWTNRLGYEKLLTSTSTFAPFVTFGRIDSVFLWSERSAALRWLLMETGGALYLVNYVRDAAMLLEDNRPKPAIDSVPTSYVPLANGIIIANGQRVRRFNGWPLDLSVSTIIPRLLDLAYVNHGYELIPPAPSPWGVDEKDDLYDMDLASRTTVATGNETQDKGLGTLSTDTTHEFRYRMSFVDQTGSESALSPPSTAVSWTTPASGTTYRKVVALDIDTGPPGTVARRLYRTQYNTDTFQFVVEIPNNVERMYYDSVPGTALGAEAPSDLTPMPCPNARFVAQAANCTFFDGGPANPTAIFYSMPGTPAQFSVLDYFYVGGDGGDVTGLAGFYNSVVVFRERQIDVITGTYPDFSIDAMLLDAGGDAPQTTQAVPGHGIVFLSNDGVYSLTGGLEGGSEAKIDLISGPIQGYIKRINRAVSAKSVAVLCRRWKEYQLWVPLDGADDISVGLIYHYDRKEWTVRTGWPVACVTSTPEGDVIFGHRIGANGSNNAESGLFVMSGARQMGYTKKGENFVPGGVPTSVYLSRLEDMGDSVDKKHLRYVYVNQMTAGSNTTPVQAEADRGLVVNVGPALASQPADRALLPVFGSGLENESGVWDTSTWAQPVPIDVRYSLVLDGAGYTQFRLSTTNDLVLTGYTLGVVGSTTEVIEGRAATTRRPT